MKWEIVRKRFMGLMIHPSGSQPGCWIMIFGVMNSSHGVRRTERRSYKGRYSRQYYVVLADKNRNFCSPPLLGGFSGFNGGFFDPRNVVIPVAVSVFPDEIYAAPNMGSESLS